MSRLRTSRNPVLWMLSIFALAATLLILGISRSLDIEVEMLEREINDEREYSHQVMVTACELKTRGLGNDQVAQYVATALADSQFIGFAFLHSDNAVEHSFQRLPLVIDQEDRLIESMKEGNRGIGRFNVLRKIRLLAEIKDLHGREEWGYRSVLEAYNND